jgi:peptide/nickel transport system ATP-binding protein
LTKSFPSLHGEKVVMSGIEGSPPDLRQVPSGCPFHPRCAWAMDICTYEVPPALELNDVSGKRQVLCWLQDGEHEVPPELALVPPVAGTEAARPSMRVHGTPVRIHGATEGGITRDH